MADITALILTKDEEKFIGQCIDSISNVVKRIVVIDSYSDDKTVEIARSKGAEVYQHIFENYAKQYIYGENIANIKTKWTLRIDADERFTKKSAREIEILCNENEFTNVNGIIVRYVNIFMNKKLYHGGMYPFEKLEIYKTGKGKIEDRNMDEHIILSGGRIVKCKEDGEHLYYRGLDLFVQKHNWYSMREVKDYYEREKNDEYDKMTKFKMNFYYKLPIFFRARLYYIFRFYFQAGFLDGKVGKIVAVLQAYLYRFLVDAKIYEYEVMNKNINEDKKIFKKNSI